ncbi:LysR family transcriptional regulator [Azospirillum agricola]|uniref:LysR family transcriptional regulator n=1 Tax=Azospirillum agricola TaxID=1720247 RepID=UPI000A0F08CD|nr:LysR family transcriptional regulator [Azospirillum agricola]MBP2230075.1 DNA-binding transcriptional LysR family regulator [Azospirillum agricola]SMH28367.1 DNA-binding transcriptional regulator, LysR family [Azospirillum lipoferum]
MADFNWNDLRYFLAVARAGTLTTAAQRLRADHSTVSRRITALEEALRVTLFERRPSGFTLTTQGERLKDTAEAMESAAFLAQSMVADGDSSLSGPVRIGAPEGFGSCFLAPRIGGLCDRHPDLEVQLVAMPRVFSLSKREADLAISLSCPQEGRLYARKLTDYRLGLYATADYLDAHPPIGNRAALASHDFIGYIDDLIFAPELDYIEAIGTITPRIKSSSLVAQMKATLAGAGLCMLPAFIARSEPALVPVLQEEVTITRSFWLIVHEDMRSMARIAVAADFIAETVRREQGLFLPS